VSVHPSGPDGGEGKGGEVLRYALVQKEGLADPRFREKISASLKAVGGADLVPVPLESLVSLSTTFLPPLVFFDKKEVLKGVDSLKNIYDEDLRRDLETGGVVEVGNGPGLDIEKLLALQPEAVMTNLVEGEWNVVPGLRRAGIPVLVNSDYLETSPLGRAEWVKFVALFIDAEQEAELFFREIEERYLSLREMVKDLDRPSEEKPEVFFNNPQSGRWVVPGGGGYMAAFVRDAGASYIWEDERGSASLVLDEEAVFARVLRAEVWLHQYGWRSLGEALRQKPAFARLEAVRGGRVVNNDARVNLSGSNDFYESGPYWPDRILADLISIFYPDLLPDHKLYYYRFLERE
jgi:iron complex transport system substrate-binding protein